MLKHEKCVTGASPLLDTKDEKRNLQDRIDEKSRESRKCMKE